MKYGLTQIGLVKGGIPQGSVLGPTLFVVYVNDIPGSLASPANMLADDLKGLKDVENVQDWAILQQDLDQIASWCATKWLLPPNTSKCKVVHAGKNNVNHEYKLTVGGKDAILDSSLAERDLGVYIEPSLSFDHHIQETMGKCTKIMRVIKKNITSRSPMLIPPGLL